MDSRVLVVKEETLGLLFLFIFIYIKINKLGIKARCVVICCVSWPNPLCPESLGCVTKQGSKDSSFHLFPF